jgi:general secretion pathway protein A
MYERFFGLVDAPFRLTPDPRYLFLSRKHADALAHLRLGLSESSGFVCITGDVGTGKTTVLRRFLGELAPESSVAYVVNPTLSPLELLQTINSEFGLPARRTSKKELIDHLNRHLLTQREAGSRAVVVVDEAQALSMEVLEHLRLLSNLETTTEKLLRIILVGQPQLRALLAHHELAQLNQRITLRWHIGPLDREETMAYVRHRLEVASEGQVRDVFSRAALRAIHGRSGGVPRLINMLCHRAMLAAFAAERRTVTLRSVWRAYREVATLPLPARSAPAPRAPWASAALAVGVVGLAVGAVGVVPRLRPDAPVVPTQVSSPPAADAVPEPPAVSEATPDPPPVATAPDPPAAAAAPEPLTVAALAAPATGGEAAAGEVTTASPPAPDAPAAAASDPAPAPPESQSSAEAGTPPGPSADGAPPKAEAAPPPPPVDATKEIESRLASLDAAASARAALDVVLRAWQVPPVSADETVMPDDFARIADRRGLEYLALRGNTAMLRLLDVPAVLELQLPGASGPRYAALVGLRDGAPLVAAGDGAPVAVSQALLEHAWYGQAHVFSRDFEALGPGTLSGHSRGARVTRLQGLLKRVGTYGGEESGLYDAATASAVLDFQRSRYVSADGIVGRLTRVALYAAAGGYPRPTLSEVVGDSS